MTSPNLPMPPEGAKLVPCEPTEEMVEAAIIAHWGQDLWRNDGFWLDADGTDEDRKKERAKYRRILAAGIAASPTIPAQTAGAVGVKPLEWIEQFGGGWYALSQVGNYSIQDCEESIFEWSGSNEPGAENGDAYGKELSPEAAKAAAQADFERRILSAPTPPAAGGDAGARRGMLSRVDTREASPEDCVPALSPDVEPVAWVSDNDLLLLKEGRTITVYFSDRQFRIFNNPLYPASVLASRDADLARLVEETGSTSVDDMLDMALVGHSLMNAIDMLRNTEGPFHDWTPAEDPAEIVIDLENALHEAEAALATARTTSEQAAEALEPFARLTEGEVFAHFAREAANTFVLASPAGNRFGFINAECFEQARDTLAALRAATTGQEAGRG